MDRDKLRSETLNLLRFPLAIVIVIVHVFASIDLTVQGDNYSFVNMPLFSGIINFIEAFLKGQSVPIYYFISGYVFFLGAELTINKYQQKLKNRVKTLLIPYLVWNVISVLSCLIFFIPALSHLSYTAFNTTLNFSISSILNCFWDTTNSIFSNAGPTGLQPIYPHNFPLWFLRDLMIVVLSIPIIYPILKKTKYYLIILFSVLWFIVGYSHDIARLDQIFSAYFFFYLGAYFSINKIDMLASFNKVFKPSVILYFVLGVTYMILINTEFDNYIWIIKRINVIIGLFFAYNVAAWLLKKNICKPNKFLSSASFFIYVSHVIIFSYVLKVIFKIVMPETQYSVTFVYSITLIVVILILLLAYYLMSKYTPRLLKLLTGRK